MILDAIDENITDSLLDKCLNMLRYGVSIEKAITSKKLLVLDWSTYPVDKFKTLLTKLDDDSLAEYFEGNINLINNKDLVRVILENREQEIITRKATPEYFWIRLVDWGYIHNNYYETMSRDERLEKCVELTKTIKL